MREERIPPLMVDLSSLQLSMGVAFFSSSEVKVTGKALPPPEAPNVNPSYSSFPFLTKRSSHQFGVAPH